MAGKVSLGWRRRNGSQTANQKKRKKTGRTFLCAPPVLHLRSHSLIPVIHYFSDCSLIFMSYLFQIRCGSNPFDLPKLLFGKNLWNLLVMVTRNFAGIRLRFKGLCLYSSEDFTDHPVVRYLPGGREEENRLYLTSLLYLELCTLRCLWNYLGTSGSGSGLKLQDTLSTYFQSFVTYPASVEPGRSEISCNGFWGFDAERKNLFTLVHWSNSLFS